MDKDRIKGKAKQVEGTLKDAKGDFTEDPSDDIAAKAKKVEGKAQEGLGKLKDAGRKVGKEAERKRKAA